MNNLQNINIGLGFSQHWNKKCLIKKSQQALQFSHDFSSYSVQKKKQGSRRSIILPGHVGGVFFIHNGKAHISVHISAKMIGHKFGEFASTRKKPIHKKKK